MTTKLAMPSHPGIVVESQNDLMKLPSPTLNMNRTVFTASPAKITCASSGVNCTLRIQPVSCWVKSSSLTVLHVEYFNKLTVVLQLPMAIKVPSWLQHTALGMDTPLQIMLTSSPVVANS